MPHASFLQAQIGLANGMVEPEFSLCPEFCFPENLKNDKDCPKKYAGVNNWYKEKQLECTKICEFLGLKLFL